MPRRGMSMKDKLTDIAAKMLGGKPEDTSWVTR